MRYRRVSDLLGRERVVEVAAETSVREACQIMALMGVSALVVTAGDGFVGLFTGRDATAQVIALSRDPDRTTLAEVVANAPPTVGPDATPTEALLLLLDAKLQELPVTEGARVLGLVSLRRLLEAQMEGNGAELHEEPEATAPSARQTRL